MNQPALGFSIVEESDGFRSLREPWNTLWASLDRPHCFQVSTGAGMLGGSSQNAADTSCGLCAADLTGGWY